MSIPLGLPLSSSWGGHFLLGRRYGCSFGSGLGGCLQLRSSLRTVSGCVRRSTTPSRRSWTGDLRIGSDGSDRGRSTSARGPNSWSIDIFAALLGLLKLGWSHTWWTALLLTEMTCQRRMDRQVDVEVTCLGGLAYRWGTLRWSLSFRSRL